MGSWVNNVPLAPPTVSMKIKRMRVIQTSLTVDPSTSNPTSLPIPAVHVQLQTTPTIVASYSRSSSFSQPVAKRIVEPRPFALRHWSRSGQVFTCTVIEMCCWRQLRAAMPANPSLLQRVSTIRRLLKNGQLQLKR